MPSRRFFLTAAGAGAVILGATATGFAVLPSSVDRARRPWLDAGRSFGDPRLDALAFAILAPNPHNRQPWLIRLEDPASFSVYCQLDRRLPQTDPVDRQIVIGFGAFLELLRMAARAQGHEAALHLFPEGMPAGRLDERPIARVHLVEAAADVDPLFEQALQRRTCRTPFRDDVPGTDVLERVFAEPMTHFSTDSARNRSIRSLCLEGWSVEHSHLPTKKESINLTRIGAEEVNASPDGIALYGRAIEAARVAGLLTRKRMAEPNSWASKQVDSFYRRALDSSPVFGWLTATGDTQVDRIDAGRRWIRLQLAATREGLAFQPLSQVLQEFPPMQPLLARAHEMLAPQGGRVHGLFRLGFSRYPEPAPRWQLSSRLLAST